MSGKREKTLFAMTEKEKDVLLTPWSLIHFLSGAAIKGFGWDFWSNFVIHGAYEVKDHYNKDRIYNSSFNSVGDQVCSMAGWSLAQNGDTNLVYVFVVAYGLMALIGQEEYVG